MSIRTHETKISMGVWSVARHPQQDNQKLSGKAFGLFLYGADEELQGEDFLSREEALELRDYITRYLDEPTTQSYGQRAASTPVAARPMTARPTAPKKGNTK